MESKKNYERCLKRGVETSSLGEVITKILRRDDRNTPVQSNEESENSEEEEETIKEEHSSEENGSDDENQEESNEEDCIIDQRVLDGLTQQQQLVINYVVDLLNNKINHRTHPTAICVEGPAGTGKTTVLVRLCKFIDDNCLGVALFTASSGVAAMKYTEGRTAHSMFGFPLHFDRNPTNSCNISQWNLEKITSASLIVYDEVNMANRYHIEMLDRSLKQLMGSNKMFGGKIVVFAGDFRQVAPVDGDRLVVNASLKSSPLWPQLKVFSLTEGQRTKEDPKFMKCLMKLGTGRLQSVDIDDDEHIPLMNIQYTQKITDLINFVYPEDVLNNPDVCARRTILTTRNEHAEKISNFICSTLKGKYYVCCVGDEFALGCGRDPEFGSPVRNLKLKIGCLCMLVCNIYYPTTLLTGAKVIVEDIQLPNAIIVRRPGKRETYLIEKKIFRVRSFGEEIFFMQFPLKVAYATSVFKAQSGTFDRVGVDLCNSSFRHGELYLALSRVRRREDVMVLVNENQVIDDVPYAESIIHTELISGLHH